MGFCAGLQRLEKGSRTAARRYRTSRAAVLARLLEIYVRKGIRPVEALKAGLGDPALSAEALSGCFGKRELMTVQARLNPAGLTCLTEDKSIFYPLCAGLGLPVPATYAVIGRDGGWTAEGTPLSGRLASLRYLAEQAPAEFVVKPAAGVYGEGVAVLRRTGDGFVDHAGRTRSAAELCDALCADPKHERFVIQERLANHPDIERLTGCAYLQTVRVATLVDREGTARILYAEWKIIGGDAPTDNFAHGRSGNLTSCVTLDSGAVGPAMTSSPDGVGTVTVEAHPKTGARLVGFRLPGWHELIALARASALLFRPLRTLGWDIALTPRGPVVVEGNLWWDPPTPSPPGMPSGRDWFKAA